MYPHRLLTPGQESTVRSKLIPPSNPSTSCLSRQVLKMNFFSLKLILRGHLTAPWMLNTLPPGIAQAIKDRVLCFMLNDFGVGCPIADIVRWVKTSSRFIIPCTFKSYRGGLKNKLLNSNAKGVAGLHPSSVPWWGFKLAQLILCLMPIGPHPGFNA